MLEFWKSGAMHETNAFYYSTTPSFHQEVFSKKNNDGKSNMKKIMIFIFVLCVPAFSQSRFAIEAGGGIDLVSTPDNSSTIFDNGYSFAVSSIYNFNETISLMGTLAFHRAEGGISGSLYPTAQGYSINNPDKPNIYAYEINFGLRANFSDKMVKPYFVIRTGFLFTNVSHLSISNFYNNGYYAQGWKENNRIAIFISPGLGLNFSLMENLNFLLEARFNLTTGTDYSFFPVTTGFQLRL